MTIIRDGAGKGNQLKVDANNRAHTQSVSESEALHSAEQGDAYNLNTGLISVTGDATLCYIKNNEDQDLVIEAIALGSFEGITHSDDPYITLKRNPTGGDLISDATAVSMNANRNFGSNKTLTADVYKGKVGGTITGGTDAAILQVTPGGRSFYTINFILPKGSSLAVDLTANVSSGSANYYAAIICYLKDPEGSDL
jgi:hypothetical protein